MQGTLGTGLVARRATWGALALLALVAALLVGASAARAATLSGVVTWQRGGDAPVPLPDATVYLHEAGRGTLDRTQTTALGGYVMRAPDGVYDVEVVAPGREPVRFAGVDLTRDRQLDAVLVATGHARLHGTVRESDGRAVPRATVDLWTPAGSVEAVTTADGSFSVAAQQGEYYVWLASGDADRWWRFTVDQLALGGERELDLVLPQETTLTAHVLGPDDAPVVGANVGLPTMEQPDIASGVRGRLESGRSDTETDAAGAAVLRVFDGSVPGPRSRLNVSPTPQSGYGHTTAAIPAIDGPTEMVVRPARVGYLWLTLRDASGAHLDASATFGDATVYSNPNSMPFRMQAPEGRRTLRVSALEGAARRGWSFLSDAFALSNLIEQTMTLPAYDTRQVRVVDPGGQPVAGVTVTAPRMFVQHGSAPLTGTLHTQNEIAVTDTDGWVSFRTFAGARSDQAYPGEIVPPFGSGLLAHRYTFSGPTPPMRIVVELEWAPVELSGRLLDGDGEPVANASMAIDQLATTTATDGSFAFEVVPGVHRLAVRHDDWALTGDVELAADRSVELRLPSRVQLTVRVLGGGRPVEGAIVDMPPAAVHGRIGDLADATLSTGLPPATVTDAAGEVRRSVFAGSQMPGAGVVTPPEGSGYLGRRFSLPSADASATVDVSLDAADTTPPAVDCAAPPTGWHAANVAVACTASDAESGLADPRADAAFELSTDVAAGSEDANAWTGRRVVCDLAGNCAAAAAVGPISVDRAAPSIAFTPTPGPLVRGDWWTVGRVTLQVTATDANVGTIACSVDGITRPFAVTRTATSLSGSFYVTTEARHVAGCTVTDRLGHVASGLRDVNIDLRAPPRPLVSTDRPVDYSGAGGWYRDTVTVSFAEDGDYPLADGRAGSGVEPASVPAPQTFSRSGTYTVRGTVTDRSGRTSAGRVLTVRVDADAPTTTLTCPAGPVTRGARAVASWVAADGESGITSASGTLALDTATVGWRDATRVASDRVGHTASATCSYQVVHAFQLQGGLLASPDLNAVAPGVVTLPVVFSLGGDRGPRALTQARLQPIVCIGGLSSGLPLPATGPLPAVYDAVTARYAYSWQVGDDLPPGTCAALLLDLDDGTTREVRFAR